MERIEWTNEWWEDANNLDATRWVLIGDSVARQFRSTLQEMLAPHIKVDFFATSLIGNDLLEKGY
ncbi:MAG: hypothetical protein IJX66_09815 [Lachnospiraceae bacterium]|nr:hypothetical protein [Lachnospiraceae bacterium]